jgi:hypothetical protein
MSNNILADRPPGWFTDRSPERLALLDGRARAKVRAFRGIQVELGRVLLELRRADRFVLVGSTTFPLYCEAIGLSTLEGKELTALAEAAETRPEVEAKVAEGTISVQKAAAVAAVVLHPELAKAGSPDGKREGDVVGAWLEKAETSSGREIRDLLRTRTEEVRLEAPPVELRSGCRSGERPTSGGAGSFSPGRGGSGSPRGRRWRGSARTSSGGMTRRGKRRRPWDQGGAGLVREGGRPGDETCGRRSGTGFSPWGEMRARWRDAGVPSWTTHWFRSGRRTAGGRELWRYCEAIQAVRRRIWNPGRRKSEVL